MNLRTSIILLTLLTAAGTLAFGTVTIKSPSAGAALGSPVTFTASATANNCSKGVASMGVYVDNKRVHVSKGNDLSADIDMSVGKHHAVVQEWDYCGNASFSSRDITVTTTKDSSASGSGGHTLSNLHVSDGWVIYGEYPPAYFICTKCGSELSWSTKLGVAKPSLSGSSAKFSIGGSKPYSDVLFTNSMIGFKSKHGLLDKDKTLVPTLHDFTYDVYFYGDNLEKSQVLEFDVSQFFKGHSLVFGNQCRIAGGHGWDIWNSKTTHWIKTGIPCNPKSGAWNHLTIVMHRNADNSTLYKSFTLNGVTHTINKSYPAGTVPDSWWGVSINFQMDGNKHQDPYTVYLDKLTFTYK